MISMPSCVCIMTMLRKRPQKWTGRCKLCIQGRTGLPWCCTIVGIRRTRFWRLRLWTPKLVLSFIGFNGLRTKKLVPSHLCGISWRVITKLWRVTQQHFLKQYIILVVAHGSRHGSIVSLQKCGWKRRMSAWRKQINNSKVDIIHQLELFFI